MFVAYAATNHHDQAEPSNNNGKGQHTLKNSRCVLGYTQTSFRFCARLGIAVATSNEAAPKYHRDEAKKGFGQAVRKHLCHKTIYPATAESS